MPDYAELSYLYLWFFMFLVSGLVAAILIIKTAIDLKKLYGNSAIVRILLFVASVGFPFFTIGFFTSYGS